MELKLTYYHIITDPLNSAGDRVIYSSRTGETFVLNKLFWNYLQQGKFSLLTEEVRSKLIESKILVASDEDELTTTVNENIEASNRTTGQLYEVIQPTAMCQLGCDYCGQSHTKDYLDKKLYAPMLERIEKKAKAGQYNSLKIGWFGAEPLMALPQMRELSPQLKELADKFDLSYSSKVVTNGLSLKPAIFKELAEEHAVSNIEITLDGTSEYHDVHRPTKSMEKTFDLILENIENVTNM